MVVSNLNLWDYKAGVVDPVVADHLAALMNVKLNLVSHFPNLPWQISYSFYTRSLEEELVGCFGDKLHNFDWFLHVENNNSPESRYNLFLPGM